MTSNIFLNLSQDELIQESINRGEGEIAANGALLVETGKRTGRSPLDRFIVKDETTEDSVDWGEVNRPFDSEDFDQLWQRVEKFLNDKDTFVSNLHVGQHGRTLYSCRNKNPVGLAQSIWLPNVYQTRFI